MRAYDGFMTLLGAVSALCVALTVPLVLFDILGRNLGTWSIGWSVEVVEYALIVATFVGAPWLLYRNGHVAIDSLRSFLSAKYGARVHFVPNLAGTVISFTVFFYSVSTLLVSYRQGSLIVKELVFPEWWMLCPISFGFFLVFLEFVRRLVMINASPEEH